MRRRAGTDDDVGDDDDDDNDGSPDDDDDSMAPNVAREGLTNETTTRSGRPVRQVNSADLVLCGALVIRRAFFWLAPEVYVRV